MSVQSRKDAERTYAKIRYDYYKAHNVCPGCGRETPIKGKVYCINCAEAQAVCNMLRRARMTDEEKAEEYRKRIPKKRMLYYGRKEAGLCVTCGKPARQGKTRCKICAEKNNRKQRGRDRARNDKRRSN